MFTTPPLSASSGVMADDWWGWYYLRQRPRKRCLVLILHSLFTSFNSIVFRICGDLVSVFLRPIPLLTTTLTVSSDKTLVSKKFVGERCLIWTFQFQTVHPVDNIVIGEGRRSHCIRRTRPPAGMMGESSLFMQSRSQSAGIFWWRTAPLC